MSKHPHRGRLRQGTPHPVMQLKLALGLLGLFSFYALLLNTGLPTFAKTGAPVAALNQTLKEAVSVIDSDGPSHPLTQPAQGRQPSVRSAPQAELEPFDMAVKDTVAPLPIAQSEPHTNAVNVSSTDGQKSHAVSESKSLSHAGAQVAASGSSGSKSAKAVHSPEKAETHSSLSAKPSHPDGTTSKLSQEETPDAANTSPDDPEALPLELSGPNPAVAAQTSTSALIRIVVSLLIVLGMVLAFVKWVVPRLITRYPEFFENLEAKSKVAAERSMRIPNVDEEETHKRGLFSGGSPTTRRANWMRRARQGQHSDTSYHQMPAAIHSNQFEVLSSTSLGNGKDLHLVEIRGRHLVIATTPYQVSLIQDLTEGPYKPLQELPAELQALGSEPDHTPPPVKQARAAKSPNYTEPDFSGELEARTVSRPSANASKMADNPVSANHSEAPDPLDKIYLKYLNQPSTEGTPDPVGLPKASIEGNPDEDVVILDDYDDLYHS